MYGQHIFNYIKQQYLVLFLVVYNLIVKPLKKKIYDNICIDQFQSRNELKAPEMNYRFLWFEYNLFIGTGPDTVQI